MKIPSNWFQIIGTIILTAGIGWTAWSSFPLLQGLLDNNPNNTSGLNQKISDYFKNGLETNKETCKNQDYQTVLVDASRFYESINKELAFLWWGIFDIEDQLFLKYEKFNQLNPDSYKKLGRAIAWQTCNANQFLSNSGLNNPSGPNLLLEINHPMCTLWDNPFTYGGWDSTGTPYKFLGDDPDVPGSTRTESYSAADTLADLDCLEIFSFRSAVYAAFPVVVFPYDQPVLSYPTSINLVDLARHTPGLKILDISEIYIGDLSPMVAFKDLEFLYMQGTSTKKIEQFDLSPDQPSSELTHYLYVLTNLKLLDLSNTNSGNLISLSGLKNLRVLMLANTKTNTLAGIQSLKNLRYLDVSHTNINDLQQLEHVTTLRYLDISNTYVSNLNALIPLDQLQELNISNSEAVFLFQTSAKNINVLKNLKSLRKVTATGILSRDNCTEVKKILRGVTVSC